MTEIEYTIRKICQRRAVGFTSIESVAFTKRVSFGLASLTELLPTVANAFYYIDLMNWVTGVNTGIAWIRLTDLGGGSGGDINIPIAGNSSTGILFQGIETNNMVYVVNTFSAGSFVLFGTVYKVTYA